MADSIHVGTDGACLGVFWLLTVYSRMVKLYQTRTFQFKIIKSLVLKKINSFCRREHTVLCFSDCLGESAFQGLLSFLALTSYISQTSVVKYKPVVKEYLDTSR